MDTYIKGKIPFRGVATAVATPFCGDEIDFTAFEAHVRWQAEMGIDAICVCGTTGEAATLCRAERRKLTAGAKETVGDSIPLIVGCGSADTKTACNYAHDAVENGADALLVITPYCNKGNGGGIIEHFRRVADAACGKPVILYNVPSRTGVNLSIEQYGELSKIENICAVKEATSDMQKITCLCGAGALAVYSGNDETVLPVISLGGQGVISVLSNIAPAAVSAMASLALDGDFAVARLLAQKYARLVSLLFAETNPAPLKYAMKLLLLSNGEMRLPLGEISDKLQKEIRDEMTALSML